MLTVMIDTCNCNRMSCSYINVNNLLTVEWCGLDWSVRMDLFHLTGGVWLFPSHDLIQSQFVESYRMGSNGGEKNVITKSFLIIIFVSCEFMNII